MLDTSNPEKPSESLVEEPAISETDQPIPQAETPPARRNILTSLGKKKLLIIGASVFLIIVLGGLVFARLNKPEVLIGPIIDEGPAGDNAEQGTPEDAGEQDAPESGTPSTSATNPPASSGTGTTGSPSSTSTNPTSPPPSTSGGTTASPRTYGIGYTSSCFNPADLTIKKGDTVVFANASNGNMWPASNKHPSHTLYPEFDANGNVSSGGRYSFTFNQTGSWGYHDHIKPSCVGVITVE